MYRSDPAEYTAYRQRLRTEYANLSDILYGNLRIKVTIMKNTSLLFFLYSAISYKWPSRFSSSRRKRNTRPNVFFLYVLIWDLYKYFAGTLYGYGYISGFILTTTKWAELEERLGSRDKNDSKHFTDALPIILQLFSSFFLHFFSYNPFTRLWEVCCKCPISIVSMRSRKYLVNKPDITSSAN